MSGRKGSDRGTSQFSESSRREDAERQKGQVARGKTESQGETAQTAHEASTRSRRTEHEVSKGQS
jgi:hypothetical protein